MQKLVHVCKPHNKFIVLVGGVGGGGGEKWKESGVQIPKCIMEAENYNLQPLVPKN